MNHKICNRHKCTGCAACRDACPKQCISMCTDELDATYPVIDSSLCVDCGICIKTCPNNRDLTFRNTKKVYAAWSNDVNVRSNSASGGVAYELYRFWIQRGGVATGVIYNENCGCHFILLEKESDLYLTQNSKYTFSDTNGIFKVVKQKLDASVPVLFIGVPCQIAGLSGFLKKDYDNLTTVDIICHGMPPASYLQQHVKSIEASLGEQANLVCFRDPKYGTHTFSFTLKNRSGKEFYKKKVLSRDNYQLGYHRALIYRENCYHCSYARKDRISDLTIGDFSGLGKYEPICYDKLNVSCILQNTEKGAELLSNMDNSVTLHERPMREAFDVEAQLKAPSLKHSGRVIFEETYRITRNFKVACDKALKGEKRKSIKLLIYRTIKVVIYNILVLLKIKRK